MTVKRKYIIYGIAYAAVAVIAAVCFSIAQPILSYAEGWHTFYYDSYFVSLTASERGWGEVARCFLLQFFAHPWHGIAVMTVLTMCFMAVLHALTVFVIKVLPKTEKNRYSFLFSIPILFSLYTVVYITAWMGSVNIKTVFSDNANKQFMELSNMVRAKQWDDIITQCKSHRPVTNLLQQNILNMALAEKCQLGEQLLDEPCQDIRSIYIDDIQSPEIAVLLSDIYFSMGHIAQSQRYAFEANEKMFNFSPRLLQRLYVTNKLFGQHKVAAKYLHWLGKTIYYKDWKTIEGKGHCIFPDNRFSGIKGLDDDLLNVARNTRGTHECQVALQYLGSLYILAGYEQQFVSMVEEFGGSKDLPKPLPKYFDEYYKHLMKK